MIERGVIMSRKMWLVRAGEGAYLFDEFINKQVVAIGWNEVGDLKGATSTGVIKNSLKKHYPEYKDGKVNITAGQLYRFACEFKIHDEVITYNPDERLYYLGNIDSEYTYSNSLISDMSHVRKVTWKGKVLRDSLSVSARNTLGSILTLIAIPEEVRDELHKYLGLEVQVSPTEVKHETEEGELEVIKEDVILKSHEFIKDKIVSLDWEQMQELVAGILRGMGYKTRISAKGPDRGRDILASPDGLGLEEPRIIAEVKHRAGQMGSNEVRSFTGGLRPGDRGIYVSIGGFTKEAKYEAERSNVPLSLIDLDLLVELIIQNYDNFDSETRSLVPLRKIYWPI